MKKLLFIITLFISLSTVHAQTDVSGNQSGTWTLTNSPYQVTGDITIPVGQTLNIEAGVNIIFQGYYRIYVNGKIMANGTEAQPVVFTPANHNTGWGGIRLDGTPDISIFRHCLFEYGKTSATGNYPDMHGGAVVLKDADAEFYHCHFENNDATGDDNGMGGAVYCINTGSSTQSLTRFEDCIFKNNHAYGEGGAIKFTNDGKTPVIRCQFINNNAGYGGGAILYYTAYDAQVIQSLFYMNSSDNSGGGAIKTLNPQTDLHITNCTFAYNSAYGAGEGGAIDLSYADLTAINSIFYGNTQTYGDEVNIGMNATAQIDYCDINMPADANGSHNLNNVNPMFVNPGQIDFHLQSQSPCIDAGIDVGLPYNGSAPDLGCYEYETNSTDEWTTAKINIFPNPAYNVIQLQQTEANPLHIQITNMQGKILFNRKTNSPIEQFDISNLAAGTYLLTVEKKQKTYRKIFLKN